MNNNTKSCLLLEQAHAAWGRMSRMRQRRCRYTRYTYGDQWSDTVRDRKGNAISERELLTVGGREPLSNNLIRRMVKAVIGRWRMAADTLPKDDAGQLQRWRTFNHLDEVDARTLEEFLISGMAIHRVWAERRPAGDGVWVDNVSPDMFFINAVRDCRATDTELIGRLIDISPGEMVMRFARGNRKRATELRELYAAMEGASTVFSSDTINPDGEAFFHARQGRCRVVEVCRSNAAKCSDATIRSKPPSASCL